MKILAGTQRKRKTAASYTVTTPETEAGPVSAAASLTSHPLFMRVVWGLLLLSLAESMVLASMVYRMPMETYADQQDTQFDPESVQAVLDGQAGLLGLADRSGQAVAAASYAAGPIPYPAVARLEDADIPGLPANLAKLKQQQQAIPAVPDDAEKPLPEDTHPSLPAPNQIPRAKMPVLDFHSVLEQLVPSAASKNPPAPDVPPAASKNPPDAAGAPVKPAPLSRPDQPAAVVIPGKQDAAPIEMYRPGASQVASLPPPGGMIIKPHANSTAADAWPQPVTPPQRHRDSATPEEQHAAPSAATGRPAADAAPLLDRGAPAPAAHPATADPHPVPPALPAHHSVHPPVQLPMPPDALAPRHLPRLPMAGPVFADGPRVVMPLSDVPPPMRMNRPRVIVPLLPIAPRPPVILARPPAVMPAPPGGEQRLPHPPARLLPGAPDTDAPVEERPDPVHRRSDGQHMETDGPPPEGDNPVTWVHPPRPIPALRGAGWRLDS